MKKVLLASTALIMSAGIAAADVSVGGDGRMGVQDGFGDEGLRFTSRIRISFSASGETDAGLAFGGSIRADNAGGFNVTDQNGNRIGDDSFNATSVDDLELTGGGGVLGQAGSVFIEGAFGKLTMGDVDGAAAAAVGYVSGVGLTGLSDLNGNTYIANVGPNLPGVLYEYAAGDFAVYVSASNPGDVFTGDDDVPVAWALGGSYSFGNFSVALGYEDNDAGTDHIIGGVTGTFGDFTGKLIYGTASGAVDGDQWGLSGDYTFGATTLTAFYIDSEEVLGQEAWGLGASYDLGGGASLKAGYVTDETASDEAYDFGISFTF
jgi:outer membrane protein OmpU